MNAKPNGNGKRFRIQGLALGMALSTPFGLFWALQNGLVVVAAVLFGLLAAAMLLTLWKG